MDLRDGIRLFGFGICRCWYSMYVYDEEIEQFIFQLSDDRCQFSQKSPCCHWTLMRNFRLVAHLRAYCTVCTYLCLEADFASHPSMVCSAHPFSYLYRHQPSRLTQRLLKLACYKSVNRYGFRSISLREHPSGRPFAPAHRELLQYETI